MDTRRDIQDELNEMAPGFLRSKPVDAPQGYFENLPDHILNRWKKEESHRIVGRVRWKRIFGAAAVIASLLAGGWWLFINESKKEISITAEEAYQYIYENIDEFESLIEARGLYSDREMQEIDEEEIHQYLLEEEFSEQEDLF